MLHVKSFFKGVRQSTLHGLRISARQTGSRNHKVVFGRPAQHHNGLEGEDSENQGKHKNDIGSAN